MDGPASQDIVISGGENISTVEVEAALYHHPSILEAAVVAMPHRHWGGAPCAFIPLKDGHLWSDGESTCLDHRRTSATDIIAFCRDRMAHYKAPRMVVHVPGGLPKTSTGKVQKFALRERARELATRHDENVCHE